MADNFGESYMPGSQGTQNNQNGGAQGPGGANPVQTAIQMLSLRLPHFAGANGMTAPGLMGGPGNAGTPGAGLNGGGMNPLLMALLHLAGLSGQPGGGPMGAGASGIGASPSMSPGGFGAPPMPKFTPASGPWGPGLPAQPQPGPGVPTFPPTGGGPFMDRTNPGVGNRGDGAPLNGFEPVGGSHGPWNRMG